MTSPTCEAEALACLQVAHRFEIAHRTANFKPGRVPRPGFLCLSGSAVLWLPACH